MEITPANSLTIHRFNEFKIQCIDMLQLIFPFKTHFQAGGLGDLEYPLLADITKQISIDYDVLIKEEGIALRGLYIIDPNGVIRQKTVNDLPVGRSVDETLRLIEAIQHFEKHGEGLYFNMSYFKFTLPNLNLFLNVFFSFLSPFQFVQPIGVVTRTQLQLSQVLKSLKSISASNILNL